LRYTQWHPGYVGTRDAQAREREGDGMRPVYDLSGDFAGSIDELGIVHDPQGNRAGAFNPYTRQVRDEGGAVVGQVHVDGYLYGRQGEFLGTVAPDGEEVRDGFGTRVGRIPRDGSLPPARDLQQRGAAALLLLCRPTPPARDVRGLIKQWRSGRLPGFFVQRLVLWAVIALFATVWLFGAQLVALLGGHGDPVAVLAGLGVAAVFVFLFVRDVRAMLK